MTNRILLILACASTAVAPSLAARAQSTDRAAAQPAASWSSPSLRNETVVAPNGAVTTQHRAAGQRQVGHRRPKRVERVTDGVYAMRGWGIASSFAIEAPAGWIIIDTGDHTQAATEMRAMLEQTLGRKIKVAAILLTHLHYANGTGAFLDPGAEVWGHEHLDRNMRATTGISVLSGTYQARAAAQFGVFHPTKRARRVSEQARLHAGEAAGGLQLPAADTAVPGRPRRRRGRGRRCRCRSLPSGRTRATALASTSPASACLSPTACHTGRCSTSTRCAAVRTAIRRYSSRTRAGSSRRTRRSCSTSMAPP